METGIPESSSLVNSTSVHAEPIDASSAVLYASSDSLIKEVITGNRVRPLGMLRD